MNQTYSIMKNVNVFVLSLGLMFWGFMPVQAQLSSPPSGWNQKASVTQYIGLVKVNIKYSSPDVTAGNGQSRKGQIWGQLVPYGLNNLGFGTATAAPWRAGANENTVISVSHDVQVEGKALKAGSYGLHMIAQPEGKSWTVIFSHNTSAWGSFFYDEKEDALRVDVMPVKNEYHEWLTFEFEDRQPQSTVATLQWENLKVPFKIEVPNMQDLYVAQMARELQSSAGFNSQNWAQAATYCVQNNTHLELGLQWADAAINAPFIGQKNFNNLQTKASVLMAMEKEGEAMAVMEEAINHPTAGVIQLHQYGRQLLSLGKKEKAMEVFQLNAQRHPDTWPVNVGLARGYSAMGEFKKALKHAKLAQENVPDGDSLNANSVASMIDKLGKKEDVN